MNPGKKSPSMGTPSMYSHVTTRSSANLKSTRSMRSVRLPWYQRPILTDAYFLDIQRGSLFFSIYSLLLSIFTVITAVFDLYSLGMAAPGSTHYGFYFISYQFVYVGNRYVRNVLILFALFSLIAAVAVFVSSILLIIALRKEYEHKILPWLYIFAVFTVLRFLAWLFFSIVNDLIFGYNITMCLLWAVFCALNVYGWILVYSLYLELSDLTKLEDLAHLRGFFSRFYDDGRFGNSAIFWSCIPTLISYFTETTHKNTSAEHASMGTMASLNASTTHSLAGSRPTTPHSTVSTQPVM